MVSLLLAYLAHWKFLQEVEQEKVNKSFLKVIKENNNHRTKYIKVKQEDTEETWFTLAIYLNSIAIFEGILPVASKKKNYFDFANASVIW